MDLDMALSGSLAWNLTTAPVVWLATYNRLLLSTLKSPVWSLFIMLKLFLFSFFSHLSIIYLHIVVAPAAGSPFMPGEALGDLCGCHMTWLQTGLCMCSVVAGRFVSKVFLQCQPGLEAQAFSPSYS